MVERIQGISEKRFEFDPNCLSILFPLCHFFETLVVNQQSVEMVPCCSRRLLLQAWKTPSSRPVVPPERFVCGWLLLPRIEALLCLAPLWASPQVTVPGVHGAAAKTSQRSLSILVVGVQQSLEAMLLDWGGLPGRGPKQDRREV